MTRTDYRLVLALIVSLLLHLLPLISELVAQSPAPPPPPQPLAAQLRPPVPPQQQPLILPEQPKPGAKPAQASQPRPDASDKAIKPGRWQDEVRKQFHKLDERGQFYPAEAIAQGLEGEVLVLLLLDANGQVAAARIEQGSGQRILDDAALHAVRALHSLPADAPRETLLPVRFRLRN